MFRRMGMLLCVFSLVVAAAGVASATTVFVDLSGLASYTAAYPTGVDSAGQVPLAGYTGSGYYNTYLYTGGTAGTVDNINSKFTTGNTFPAPSTATGRWP